VTGDLPGHGTPVALVTGANRGIGLEFVRQYSSAGWQVVACCREPSQADELRELSTEHSTITIESLDIADPVSVAALADRYRDQAIDLLVNNAGTLGPLPLEEHIGRQFFGQLDYDLWADVLWTNTLGSVRLTEALVENVAASSERKIVTLSSTAGSIVESNRPAMAYTTSKAALNKAMTLIASALAPREIIVAILCPGHVKTRLGLGDAGIEISDSVSGMRRLIDSFTLEDTGTFRRFNGDVVAW